MLIPLHTETTRTDERFNFPKAHVPQLGFSMADIAQTETRIAILLHLRQYPRRTGPWGKPFHDGHQISVTGNTVVFE